MQALLTFCLDLVGWAFVALMVCSFVLNLPRQASWGILARRRRALELVKWAFVAILVLVGASLLRQDWTAFAVNVASLAITLVNIESGRREIANDRNELLARSVDR